MKVDFRSCQKIKLSAFNFQLQLSGDFIIDEKSSSVKLTIKLKANFCTENVFLDCIVEHPPDLFYPAIRLT